MGVNLRKITLELIRSYEEDGRFVNLLLSSHRLDSLTREEKGLVTSLLYTTVENKLKYDYFIACFAKRQIAEIDPFVRDVLRLGLSQIIDIDSVPDFAAVNETVKLARHSGERGFINAVLRRAVEQKGNLPYPKREKNPERYISIAYSIPYKTVKLLSGVFGEETELVIRDLTKERGLSLTVNESIISTADAVAKLSAYGAKRSEYTDCGIAFDKSINPTALPGFEDGEFFVQDEASRLAVAAAYIREGDRVIDVCAAPGGKSFSAAIKAGERGAVTSFDIHESKLSLITGGRDRLGLKNLNAFTRDARFPDESLFGKADVVICDVPCSGLGVIAKKPDLRYKDNDEIAALPSLQYEILTASAKYLKPNGVLIYSTCTVIPSENEDVTDRFISENSAFSYESFTVGKLSCDKGRVTLLPHIHGTDGFYIAKLRKHND